MAEFVIKGWELTDIQKSRIGKEIIVEGYCTSHDKADLEKQFRSIFEECGEIIEVDFEREHGPCAFITFRKERAVKKALRLSRRRSYSFRVIRATPTKKEYAKLISGPAARRRTMFVTGFDTSLDKATISDRLSKYFSSCGEITKALILPQGENDPSSAMLSITVGEGGIDKVLEHCRTSDEEGGWKIQVTWLLPIPGTMNHSGEGAGYTISDEAKKGRKAKEEAKTKETKKAKKAKMTAE